jgi:NhaP-type Na+/H+ or K+/H+ antiporter
LGCWAKEGEVLAVELEFFFLIIGVIILIGFIGRIIQKWTRVPEALFLVLFGLLIGPLTGLVDGSALLQFVPIVSIAAMITILVESGVSFDISRILGTLGEAVAFTLLVAILTTLLITSAMYFLFGWDILHAALLGVIASGTTTITSMALLKGIDVHEKVRGLIMLETIINDFTLILGTFIIVDLIKLSKFDIAVASLGIFFDLSIGILAGFVFAFLWGYILERINLMRELDYASTIGFCFFLFFLADAVGGNSIIAVFAFSLFLGNYHKIKRLISRSRKNTFEEVLHSIKCVQTDFTFFMKSFFFVLLGVTFNLSLLNFSLIVLIGVLILMIILARFFSSIVISRFDKVIAQHKALISFMIPRGYVAAVLAFVPASEGIIIPHFTDIVVILVILTTFISIAGVFAFGKKKGIPRR